MSIPDHPVHFDWQNPILCESIFPFRMKKLREFLLFYWEVETLARMKKATVQERKNILGEVAASIAEKREEWQEQFDFAFTDLQANDKWFALKTQEKHQLWYLQDQIRYTKNQNWERIRRLLELFEQKNNLPAEINLNQDPKPEDLTRAQSIIEEERLKKLSHEELLKVILDRFDKAPDTYPQWLQYMTVHFSGMRYRSAHGSWADPAFLLELIGQNKNIPVPAVPEPGSITYPMDETTLQKLKRLQPKIPPWVWKEIVRYTPLRMKEVTEKDWEVSSTNRNEPGFDNTFWGNTFRTWYGKDITQWRKYHQATLDLIVSRSVCNEVSEQILHLRWLTPSGGLNFKVDWYRHRAEETQKLPANHPRKAIFKRATSVADFQPGASIFWLVWYPQPPNSANVAYSISGFNFFPDGVNMNGGAKKKRPKGKGGRLDKTGWRYGYLGNRIMRTRRLNEQEIQIQLNAKKREMELLRTRELNELKRNIALERANKNANKDEQKKSPLLKQLEKRLKQLTNPVQFNKEVDKELKKLRNIVARQEIQQTLRWRHEAIVVSVEAMASGTYVWTFETETEIGLNRRYLYDLLGTDNNDDYQIFIGYMPSLDNLPLNMDPEKFLSRTFMTREHAHQMKLRLKEMLRRDWILPGQYPDRTYPTPPKQEPKTEVPAPVEVITNLPPAEQPRWVQVVPLHNAPFITNAFYKVRNKSGFPIMLPAPKERRQKLERGTLVGVSRNHKESPTDPGDGTVRTDGKDFFYLVTVCEDFPDAVGTFILAAHTANVADPVAFKKEQEKNCLHSKVERFKFSRRLYG